MVSPIEWLATRTPPAPRELKDWLNLPDDERDPDGGTTSVTGFLLKAALTHLDYVVGRPGRDREAAYRLLAADALITYGCEAASEAADVQGALLEVLTGARSGRAVG